MPNNNDNEVVHEELQDNFKQEPLTEDEVVSNIKSEDATNDLHADKTGYNKSLDGVQTIEEDGLIHYKGGLGDFTYNPNEFQIEQINVEPDGYGNAGGPMPILKYIGRETDGDKIKIPDGVASLTLTFADTHITSAPVIQLMPILRFQVKYVLQQQCLQDVVCLSMDHVKFRALSKICRLCMLVAKICRICLS